MTAYHILHGAHNDENEDIVVDNDDPDDYEWLPGSHTPSEPSGDYENGSDRDEGDAKSLGSALELFMRRQATTEYVSSIEDESDG